MLAQTIPTFTRMQLYFSFNVIKSIISRILSKMYNFKFRFQDDFSEIKFRFQDDFSENAKKLIVNF